jgi:threonylcarbamoyladenosine tRNA methylthiotransferase MtaB
VKYSIVTFGCRVNQADSLSIESELAAAGGESVASEHAELVIVNTCSVTASADQGARQTIRRIARTNPAARIIATGCYATRCADEVAALPGVAEVVPNDRKLTIPLAFSEGHCGHLLAPGLMGRTAWTLRVQTGCEQRCSYCIIPTTRGASRSRSLDDIQAEIARVTASGYREVAVTGVHLGSYGRDLTPTSSLADLLNRLTNRCDVEEPWLLRISSLEPMDFPMQILDAAEDRHDRPVRVAPHFHLPLQHASNRILERMRRPYSLEYFARLVESIRTRLPHAAIGSDVIAGFPGETDDHFRELTAYLTESPLTHLHVFPYSDRPGTEASRLPDKVHGSVIKERAQSLREISRQLAASFRTSQTGSVRPALTIEDGTVAITDNYFKVPAPPGHARNEWVQVTLG